LRRDAARAIFAAMTNPPDTEIEPQDEERDTLTMGMDLGDEPAAAPSERGAYQVLARKYRPQDFTDLVGQEALVRTLTNAFEMNRIAHAFILTGVRGIGKTTTARIIARALNCIGPDGTGGPTIEPCGVCSNCKAIAASSHVDVLEMDAASRTGIDDIREIIEGVRYLPNSARYKVYIIDEVHMLSKAAFNGLLKTLEEPPEHVKFIFATTEFRKVPVTVLSRCQRFDLRRLDRAELATHLGNIAGKESAAIDEDALALIGRAAEGSVRDGLSLLDQAIAQHDGDGAIQAASVRDMLGLADRARTIDLFDTVMAGDAATALQELSSQYDHGAEPLMVMQDLADFTHFVTRMKVIGAAAGAGATEEEVTRGTALAARLSMPALGRAWQMLLKGIGEVQAAQNTIAAAEMVLIRLCYAADLPSPGDLVKKLSEGPGPAPTAPVQPSGGGGGGGAVQARARPQPASAPRSAPRLHSFEDLVALARQKEIRFGGDLERFVRPVKFTQGSLEITVDEGAPRDLAGKISGKLQEWTGERWIISVTGRKQEAGQTVREIKDEKRARLEEEVRSHPLVKAALEHFPKARLTVRDIKPDAETPIPGAPGDLGDDGDDGDFFV